MSCWKPVCGYEGYYDVSSDGRILSLRRGAELKFGNCGDGYLGVNLSVNGVRRGFSVHRLVAQAFIPNPDGKPQVNHKNGDKTDNRVDNLEWVSASENSLHSVRIGHSKHPKGEASPRAKHSEAIIREAKRLFSAGASAYRVAKTLGLSQWTAGDVKSGKCWAHVA